jgi:hypothetical protein
MEKNLVSRHGTVACDHDFLRVYWRWIGKIYYMKFVGQLGRQPGYCHSLSLFLACPLNTLINFLNFYKYESHPSKVRSWKQSWNGTETDNTSAVWLEFGFSRSFCNGVRTTLGIAMYVLVHILTENATVLAWKKLNISTYIFWFHETILYCDLLFSVQNEEVFPVFIKVELLILVKYPRIEESACCCL